MGQPELTIFTNNVLKEFNFLQETYGFCHVTFRTIDDEGAMVRYESARVWLEIWYDHLRGGELSIYLGLLTSKELKINLPFHLMAGSSPSLEHCLHKLAVSVAQEAQPYFIGDDTTFQRSFQEQHEQSAQWWKADRLRRVRADAIKAWQQKDYLQVISSYESIFSDLTDSEQKRLALARKYKASR